MTALSVNLNKVALLRNSRSTGIPDVAKMAHIALSAGAHGITVHPRPDQRHIRPADVGQISEIVRSFPGAEFNIEGNPFHGLLPFIRDVRPHQCTLVPDAENVLTSDRGWNLQAEFGRLAPVIAEIRALRVRVSLFMEADAESMVLARRIGADRVELYTEPYARAYGNDQQHVQLTRYVEAARIARDQGLGVNAGHDLNLDNLGMFLREVHGVLEVSIGHALIADALEYGLADVVRRYLDIVIACGEVPG